MPEPNEVFATSAHFVTTAINATHEVVLPGSRTRATGPKSAPHEWAALLPEVGAQAGRRSGVRSGGLADLWVLLVTGGWNIAAESDEMNGSHRTAVIVKLTVATGGMTA
jgi:hypothetical protein